MKKRKTVASPAWGKWRRIIVAQASSGLSVAAYCREHRIGQASFYTWKRRPKESRTSVMSSRPAEAGFVELTAAQEAVVPARLLPPGSATTVMPVVIEVVIHGRRVLMYPEFSHELLGKAIQVLEKQV